MSATEIHQEIVEESVRSVRALLDQACALRRCGINVEFIVARLEHVLARWHSPSSQAPQSV